MNTLPSIALLISTILLCGCFTAKEDISKSEIYKTDYVINGVYKTKCSLFIQRLGKGEMLVSPGDADARIPRTVGLYLTHNRDAWPEIVGVLEEGTSMRVTRLIREYNGETGSGFLVLAKILDGVYRGHEIDLRAVSLDHQQKNPVVSVPFCNRNLFEEVE